MRELLALAFVPPEKMSIAFLVLCEPEFWKPNSENENSPKIQEILNYFKTSYVAIDTVRHSRRREPLFAPTLDPLIQWSINFI